MAIASVAEEASGPTYSTVRLCRHLGHLGEDVTLRSVGSLSNEPSPGFRHAGYPPALWGRFAGASRELREAIEANVGSADIVHSNGLWLMPNIYPAHAARRAGVPLVTSPHGTLAAVAWSRSRLKKAPFWLLLQRSAVASTAMFHATSDGEYRDIRGRGYGQPVCIIPNGVEIPTVAARPPCGDGCRTMLYLGRIHPIKGIDGLIRAWGRQAASHPYWRLDIVGPEGEPGYLAKLKALVEAERVPRVRFSEPRYGPEKHDIYRQASLYVLPSHTENFGMTVAEALAAGTPVITTTGAPWSGLVEKRAGWWIPPDVDALAACLGEALVLPDETLAEMGRRGRTWMEDCFAWPKLAGEMRAAYRWLVEGGTPPPWVRLD